MAGSDSGTMTPELTSSQLGTFGIQGSPLQSVYVPARTSSKSSNTKDEHSHDLVLTRNAQGGGAHTSSASSAVVRGMLSDYDGRDAILALAQTALLTAHHALARPPPRLVTRLLNSSQSEARPDKAVSTYTLKQVYLAQEILASVRRCLVVGRWIADLYAFSSAQLARATSKTQDEDSPRQTAATSQGFLLDPPISLSDLARLAQYGLALEDVLPLAGAASPSSQHRRQLTSTQAQSSPTAATRRTPGDDAASATSSVPRTIRQRILPFGEVRPPMHEGEDAVFASALLGDGDTSQDLSSSQSRGGLEPELEVEASWENVQAHTERRRVESAQSSALAPAKREAGDAVEEDDEDSDVVQDATGAGGQLVRYSADEEALLNIEDVDPTDLSTPLPPIPSSPSSSTASARARKSSSHSHSHPSSSASSRSSALDTWLSTWETRLELLLFGTGTLAELADVLAFLSGSSLTWRWFRRSYLSRVAPHVSRFPSVRAAVGGALGGEGVALSSEGPLRMISRRQRRGLERGALYLSTLSTLLTLILLRLKRARAKRRRREVVRRMRAVWDGMEWEEGARARALAQAGLGSVLVLRGRDCDRSQGEEATDGKDSEDDDDTARMLASLTRAQRAFLAYDAALSALSTHLRWLSRERWAGLFEGGFFLYELLRPGAEKEGWEAWSGLVGALVRVGRTWTERVTGLSVG